LKNKFAVYLQFRQVGSGSDISAVTVQAESHLIQAVGGKVFINGKHTTAFPAKLGKGELVKEGSTFIVKGFTTERVAFVEQKDGSYTVDAGIRTGRAAGVSGLLYGLRNPFKYQVTEAQAKNLFHSFTPFKNIVQGKKHSRKSGEDCCSKIKHVDMKRYEQCVGDSMASGKCYAATYLNSNEEIKSELTKN